MKPYWTGVFPACTTQLKKDQSLDLPATARHFEALIESGVSGLIVCGSLGENQTLDPEEKRAVVKCAIETARGRVTLVDDYGHHPTEIRATLDAVRQAYAGRRIVLAFQPHRYTRTRDLLDDFAGVLSTADVLLVTEVYAAGEAPIAGADGRAICRAVRSRGHVEPVFVPRVEELAQPLADLLRDGDVVLAMGAGNISAVAHDLPRRLKGGA